MKASQKLDRARAAQAARYGNQYVNLGGDHYKLNTVPTGSLMLDYKTGIGGFPYGHGVEIFGANRLGKSSAIGYPVLANVQKQGKLPALIASEPRLVTPEDREWALKLGFDPDMALIQYPDHEEDAFNMLRDLVFDNLVDYIMIDSLGGIGNVSGAKKDGKPKAYGISGAVTSALNDIMPRLYKNNIGLLVVNQQRQSGSFNGNTLYESPGGEALKHHMRMRIQVKPGTKRFTAKIDDESGVLVGRELTCVFKKNNMAQAAEKSASFCFFHIETGQYGFGIDTANDIVNVAKMTGVLKGGSWLEHPTFPASKKGVHQLNGVPAVGRFLDANPKAYEQIRSEVMEVMLRKDLAAGAAQREAELMATVEEILDTTGDDVADE